MESHEIVVDATTITQMPPVTMGLTAGIVAGFLISAFTQLGSWFVLHPRTLLSLNVWTLWTYPFADSNFLNALISLLSIPIFGKLLENLYGGRALLKYVCIVVTVTGLVCALLGAITPSVTGSLTPWFDVYAGGYFGFQPILMASFVALKQAMPDSVIALAFVVRVQLKQLPLLTLGLTLAAATLLPSRGALPMAVALPVSWCYLRFFSSLATPATTGDLRDSFSLASFWPVAMQNAVLPLSRRIDALRCWPSSATATVLPVHADQAVGSAPMTQAAREHRAIATELVNQRIESMNRSGADESDLSITFDADQSFTGAAKVM